MAAAAAFFLNLRQPARQIPPRPTPTDTPQITPSPAASAAPMPRVVARAEWGARAPNHLALNEFGFAQSATDSNWYVYPGALPEVLRTVVVHHTAHLLNVDETVRNIQDLHMDLNQWADIGYHYAIDRDGVIFEGREIGVRGASVAGRNTGTVGVVVMGHFQFDQPLPVQLAALRTLIKALTAAYGLTHLAGHGEFNPESVCPGRNLVQYLDGLAMDAGLQRGTGGYVPPI